MVFLVFFYTVATMEMFAAVTSSYFWFNCHYKCLEVVVFLAYRVSQKNAFFRKNII